MKNPHAKKTGKVKDPFVDLPEEYRNEVQNLIQASNYVGVDSLIAKVTKDNAALQDAKKQDQDLKNKLADAKEAGAVYRESAKATKLKVRYARALLEASGKDSGSVVVENAPAEVPVLQS